MWGFPNDASDKEPTCQRRTHKRSVFYLWVGKIPWRKSSNPLQCSHLENPKVRGAWRGYSPWGRKESDMTLKPLSTQGSLVAALRTTTADGECLEGRTAHPLCRSLCSPRKTLWQWVETGTPGPPAAGCLGLGCPTVQTMTKEVQLQLSC